MTNSNWDNDSIQFPRLLSEILAVGLPDETLDQLCESMDLQRNEILEILERADRRFEEIKRQQTQAAQLDLAIKEADTQSLVFEWGTIESKAKPTSSLHILVDYADVQGKLRLGEIVRLGTLGQRISYEVIGFQFDGESNQTQIWIELSPVEEPNLTQVGDDSDDESSSQFMYAVDVPDWNPDNPWINAGSFDSEEEAIAFVKKHYGGDDEGRINLISEIDTP